jgi:hypothetical protein
MAKSNPSKHHRTARVVVPSRATFRSWFRRAKVAPRAAAAKWYRDRGRLFERALYHGLAQDGLRPRTSYILEGEEIDGSFLLRGNVFLLEAKWHEMPIPTKELLAFHAKLEGKLAGTLGAFLSMSGYCDKAADALTKGKALTVIMFDAVDIEACFKRRIGFKRVLEEKLRAAAESGLVYWPYTSTRVTPGSISEKKLGKS